MNHDEWVARLAEGDQSPEATEWLDRNPDARPKVEQLKRLLSASKFPIESAPPAWIVRAQDIFLVSKPSRVASWAPAFGVRSGSSDALMAQLDDEDFRLRVRAVRGAQGWDVMGQVESGGVWEVGTTVTDDQGRFSLVLAELPAELEFMQGDRYERIGLEIDPS